MGAPQPELGDGFPWPDRTVQWWQAWADAPQAEFFTSVDWQDLLDAALLHAAMWGRYDLTVAEQLHAITARYLSGDD